MIWMTVVIVAAAIVLIALIGLATRSTPELDKAPFRTAWLKIIERAKDESGYELAIINADKLLDVALRKRRFAGETMGERLIAAKNHLSKRQQVWQAHKLRNRIVHEEHVKLDKRRVHEALKGFETALKDLGAL